MGEDGGRWTYRATTKFELVINFKTAKQVGLTDLQRCCSGRAS